MSEKKAGSSLVAYAKVDLWEGELEGIINTDEKFYSLRTAGKGIDVVKIEFDSKKLVDTSEFLKKAIPAGTTAKLGLEYKGNTLGDNEDNSYIRAFIDIEADEKVLEKAKLDDVPFPIKLKKLSVGYLKYGKNSEVNNSDFRKWLEQEKKEVAEADPKQQAGD